MAALLLITAAVPDLSSAGPLVESLMEQDCPDWRLAVAVGEGGAEGGGAISIRDPRIEMVSRLGDVWPPADDLVTFVDPGVRLEPGAVRHIVGAMSGRPDADAVYGDELRPFDPVAPRRLRTAWSPESVRSGCFLGDPFVVRPAALAGLPGPDSGSRTTRHRWALHLVETGATVVHLPVPLATIGHGPVPDDESIVTLVEDHLRRGRIPAVATAAADGSIRLDPAFATPPSVSVVIPTAGTRVDPTGRDDARPGTAGGKSRGERMVERCLRSLDLVQHQELEIVVVVGEEYDGDPTGLTSLGRHRVLVVDRGPGDFSFAVAANAGVLATTGELVVLLNDDTVAHDGRWVQRMAMHAVEPSVGAVGATLLFPDGTIQHIGLVIDDARPLHPFVGRRLDDPGPRRLTSHPRTVAAVTGACLMVTRAKYLEVGGMSELYPLSFNDIDLCFKLARRGYRTVHEPGARLTHFEGSTREMAIAKWEWDSFVGRWGSVVDPWYHPGYERPDDPDDLRRNADHILPSAPVRGASAQPTPRDDRIRSVVHRQRDRSAIEPAHANR